MKFDNGFFRKFDFTREQINKNIENAKKDLKIAKKDKFPEVRFNYAYTAFIKAGIALLSFYKVKVKSVPGHHIKIIEKTTQILKDNSILTLGNIMRSKRNLDFYAGGVDITEKECKEFVSFAEQVLKRVEDIICG